MSRSEGDQVTQAAGSDPRRVAWRQLVKFLVVGCAIVALAGCYQDTPGFDATRIAPSGLRDLIAFG
ncbi:MAG: hypothetical protein QOF33_1166, partial [Thermomicrobiales bacterium]|nr:hypothetical protein [Thermomicrobiales bacterium]